MRRKRTPAENAARREERGRLATLDYWHNEVARTALAVEPATLPPAVREAVEAYRKAEGTP